eukprot:SM000187S03914  [mRNA]  locus=s187:61971:64029:- [translate_table: standard]
MAAAAAAAAAPAAAATAVGGGGATRTCRHCKRQFDPAANHPRACLRHPAHFGGETKRKFEGVETGGTMTTKGGGESRTPTIWAARLRHTLLMTTSVRPKRKTFGHSPLGRPPICDQACTHGGTKSSKAAYNSTDIGHPSSSAAAVALGTQWYKFQASSRAPLLGRPLEARRARDVYINVVYQTDTWVKDVRSTGPVS